MEKNAILEAPKQLVHEAAVQILNEVLLPAMKEVGDKFGAGELILPFVLKALDSATLCGTMGRPRSTPEPLGVMIWTAKHLKMSKLRYPTEAGRE
jgi:methanogenic corrinoid protein MtbC1